ncbi:MAG: hypothetical protein M3128_06670 [Verrucomicrobiota bacterium]|nr:hypothetical protein [Verrucomicrobiota bacterium]
MKPFIVLALFLSLARLAMAASNEAIGRTIADVDIIPTTVLQRSISPKFYKTLLVSPIKGYVVVRGNLSGTRMTGLKVVRSEPNNLNDHLALQRASEVTIAGNYTIEHPNVPSAVLVHLLLYQTTDGTLALSFAHFDGAGGNQMQYWGCTRMAVLKNDGQWVDIKGPPGLEGKGLAVRQGIKNDLNTAMKLEAFPHGPEATNMSTGR